MENIEKKRGRGRPKKMDSFINRPRPVVANPSGYSFQSGIERGFNMRNPEGKEVHITDIGLRLIFTMAEDDSIVERYYCSIGRRAKDEED